MKHHFQIRVYYEDTDLAGIVYYANYLKFTERARSELLRDLGVDQVAMKRDADIVFAVRRVEADYIRAATFDDELVVETRVASVSGARVVLEQDVLKDGDRLFASVVTVVALTGGGRPARLPADVRLTLAGSRD